MSKRTFAKIVFAFGVLLCAPVIGVKYASADQKDFYSGSKTGGPICNSRYSRDGNWYCPTDHAIKTYVAGVVDDTDVYEVLAYKELTNGPNNIDITTSTDTCSTHGSQGWNELNGNLTTGGTTSVTAGASVGLIQSSITQAISGSVSVGYAHTWVNSKDHRSCEGDSVRYSCPIKKGEHKFLVVFNHIRDVRTAQELQYSQYTYGSHKSGNLVTYGWNRVPDVNPWFTIGHIVTEGTPFATGVACVNYSKYYKTMEKGHKYGYVDGWVRLR